MRMRAILATIPHPANLFAGSSSGVPSSTTEETHAAPGQAAVHNRTNRGTDFTAGDHLRCLAPTSRQSPLRHDAAPCRRIRAAISRTAALSTQLRGLEGSVAPGIVSADHGDHGKPGSVLSSCSTLSNWTMPNHTRPGGRVPEWSWGSLGAVAACPHDKAGHCRFLAEARQEVFDSCTLRTVARIGDDCGRSPFGGFDPSQLRLTSAVCGLFMRCLWQTSARAAARRRWWRAPLSWSGCAGGSGVQSHPLRSNGRPVPVAVTAW